MISHTKASQVKRRRRRMVGGRVFLVVLLVVAYVCAKHPDVVVKKGEDKIIYQNETQAQNAASTSLCVKPGGLLSVCVKVEDETLAKNAEGCFDTKSCSLTSAPWKLVTVEAKVSPGIVSTRFSVEYNLTFDGCVQTKKEVYESENIARLTVSAGGASEWLLNGCPDPTTEDPSSDSLPTYAIVIIVLVALAVAAVAAVLGVVFLKRK